ncbi:hypothetical protein SUDANB95_05508 [Actinosynnema sp. ALI-1.44]
MPYTRHGHWFGSGRPTEPRPVRTACGGSVLCGDCAADVDRANQADPRRFYLQRAVDISGSSGTGRVADGVLWPDGSATLRWRGEHRSVAHWDSLASAEIVHGHGGATRIVWIDGGG